MCSDTRISKNKYLTEIFSFPDTFSSKIALISLHNIVKKYLNDAFSAIGPFCQPKADWQDASAELLFIRKRELTRRNVRCSFPLHLEACY